MADSISTSNLVKKARQYITSDASATTLGVLVKNAIIDVDRALRVADSFSPLAWDIVPYDELRTCTSAAISAITLADPGVFTAQSVDSDITGHGFHDNSSYHQDIVLIDGTVGPEELNGRLFLLEYVDATTFTLKTLDGLDAINTTNYTAYSSGGYVYHIGFVLNTTTILANVSSAWTFKKLVASQPPRFDGFPTEPISEQQIQNESNWTNISYAQRPKRFRHWRNMASSTSSSHYFFWYPACDQAYNVRITYQKEVPDISAWDTSTYPFHPPEVHEALWHGALARLVGENTRMKRSSDKAIAVKMEILFAKKWLLQWEKDKRRVVRLSREMMGAFGGPGGLSA